MSQEVKNYEFAYILSPSVEEGGVLPYAEKITGLIEGEGGAIRKSETPKRRQLAYPIKKERQGYFGWVTFNLSSNSLKGLEKKLDTLKEILRYLLTEAEIEKNTSSFFRPMGNMGAGKTPRSTPREAEKIDEKLDLEALDKRLEEILGK